MCVFRTIGVHTICLSPLPRFPSTCCSAPDHFPTPYMHDLFFSKRFKLGMYISRSSECTETVVITPEDLSSTWEEWIEDGAFLLKDRVHLTKHGVKAAWDLIRKAGVITQASLLPTYPILSLKGLPTLLQLGGHECFAAPAGMCSPCPQML